MRFWFFLSFIALIVTSCTKINSQEKFNIQSGYLSDYLIDGNLADWSDIPGTFLYANALGEFPNPKDLEARFRTAWSEEGILFSLLIKDDFFHPDTINPWLSDAIELFLASNYGSDDVLQITIIPNTTKPANPFIVVQDRHDAFRLNSDPILEFHCNMGENQMVIEGIIKNNVIQESMLKKGYYLMQVYVLDSDKHNTGRADIVQWHSLGHSYMNAFAMHKIELSQETSRYFNGTSRVVITDNMAEVFVFGATSGDSIELFRNDSSIVKRTSITESAFIPDKFIFYNNEINIEKDSLHIFINQDYTGSHDLFIAPRFYKKLDAKPFEREIRVFKMRDKINFPDKGGVLFIGSSSIRMWNDLEKDFSGFNIIKRGFGGSTAEDALRYIYDIVLPYKPRGIIYYEGDNDIAQGKNPKEIISHIDSFIQIVHSEIPDTWIFLLSPKPAITRIHLWDKYKDIHWKMKDLSAKNEKVFFIDVSENMFDSQGKIRQDIFSDDGLHMNRLGYELWGEVIRRELVRNGFVH